MSTISLTGGGGNALLNTDGEINQTENTFSLPLPPPGVILWLFPVSGPFKDFVDFLLN